MIKEHGQVKDICVDEATSNAIVPMGNENLSCVSEFSPNELWDISEPALFHNIRVRFDLGFSFMRVSDNILLFLNRHGDMDYLALASLSDSQLDFSGAKRKGKIVDNHADEIVEALQCSDNLGSVVDRAFGRLVDSHGVVSQSIIVSGADASGKHEVTKFVLLKSVQLAKPSDGGWWAKLFAGDLLMQEFGGVGEYVSWTELQLFFPKQKKRAAQKAEHVLLGAVLNAFGLNPSRVTDTELELFPALQSIIEHSRLDSSKVNYLSKRKKVKRWVAREAKEWTELAARSKRLALIPRKFKTWKES